MIQRIGFGGGCHWCTEAVFQSLKGVFSVEQGYISSHPPHAYLSEAVIVKFDSEVIQLRTLIQIHLQTHSSTSAHRMRTKYRSAIYTFHKEQNRAIIEILNTLQVDLIDEIITQVLPFKDFKPSEKEFSNYYIKDPNKPFCRRYIAPKLKIIEKKFPKNIKK